MSVLSPLYKLKDYKEALKFEREHSKEIRWDDRYKLYVLQEDRNFQGIWLRDKSELVGEILLSWQSTNVLCIERFTVLPAHQGKSLGHELIRLAIEWGTNSNYQLLTGTMRKGAAWKVLENFGASSLYVFLNWRNTKEDYVSFKLEL
jgi:GNAT superfamily N-acetyltransferase